MTDFATYNRYIPGQTNWESILFRAGKRLQSAELNEIQSLVLDVIARLGLSIFNEGDIISGVTPGLKGNTVSITGGTIYFHGRVRTLAPTAVSIKKVGIENIGIVGTSVKLSDTDDASYRDPATGSKNFGQPGAGREIVNVSWFVNNPQATTVFTFQDGVLRQLKSPTVFSDIIDVIARYIFNMSGNYLLDGLQASIRSATQSDFITLLIGTGHGVVHGYEVNKSMPTTILVPRALGYQFVGGEQLTFKPPSATTKEIYPLNSTPVRDIIRATGNVQASVQLTRGSGSLDILPFTPVVSIVSVVQGVTTYTQGTDYQRTGNNVDWSLGGIEPSVGTSYTVTWIFDKTLVQGTRTKTVVTDELCVKNTDDILNHSDIIRVTKIATSIGGPPVYALGTDFNLTSGRSATSQADTAQIAWVSGHGPTNGTNYYVSYEYWTHTIEGDYTAIDSYNDQDSVRDLMYLSAGLQTWDLNLSDMIDFRPTGSPPVSNTIINIDYNYYLARFDAVSLNANGEFDVMLGRPGLLDDVRRPTIPETQLPLVYLRHPPAAKASQIQLILPQNRRYTMPDIGVLERRISQLEQIVALSLLELDANNIFTPSEKIGIFTDGFRDYTRSDVTYSRNGVTYSIGMDTTNGVIRMPFVNQAIRPAIDVNASNVYIGKESVYKRLTRTKAPNPISQPSVTRQILINKDLKFAYQCHLELNPAWDTWIDEGQDPDLVTDDRFTDEIESYKLLGTSVFGSQVDFPSLYFYGQEYSDGQALPPAAAASQEKSGLVSISNNVIPFILTNTITVIGSGFPPNATNIEGFFHDIRVDLTAINPTVQGTVTAGKSTVNANALGNWSATFVIPSRIRVGVIYFKTKCVVNGIVFTGSVPYVVKGNAPVVSPEYISITSAPYFASSPDADQLRNVETDVNIEPLLMTPTFRIAQSDEVITLTVQGGIAPYHISTDHGVLSTNLLNGPGAFTCHINNNGYYGYVRINVVDSNSHKAASQILFQQIGPASDNIIMYPLQVMANPGNHVDFFVDGGSPNYTITASGGSLDKTSLTPSDKVFRWTAPTISSDTTVTITVTDILNQTAVSTVLVTESAIGLQTRVTQSVIRTPQQKYTIDIFGGTPPYSVKLVPNAIQGLDLKYLNGDMSDFPILVDNTKPWYNQIQPSNTTSPIELGILGSSGLTNPGYINYTAPSSIDVNSNQLISVVVMDSQSLATVTNIYLHGIPLHVDPSNVRIWEGMFIDIDIEGATPPFTLTDSKGLGQFPNNSGSIQISGSMLPNAYGSYTLHTVYTINTGIDLNDPDNSQTTIIVTDSTNDVVGEVDVYLIAGLVATGGVANSDDNSIDLLGQTFPSDIWIPETTDVSPQSVGLASVPRDQRPGVKWNYPLGSVGPVAQTIPIKSNQILLSAIGLFFFSKDTSSTPTPIKIEIRAVNLGFPSTLVASEVVPASSIQTSNNGSIETVIVFRDPVWLLGDKTYAAVLQTGSGSYVAFGMKIGETDLITGKVVGKGSDGLVLVSSNGETWTPIQDEDLKFNLYIGFAQLGTDVCEFLNYGPSQIGTFGSFVMNVSMFLAACTNIQWYYSLDNGSSWRRFLPGKETGLIEDGTQIKLRAELSTATVSASPSFNWQNVSLLLRRNFATGDHIAHNVAMPSPVTFDHIKIILDQIAPSTSTIVVYYSINDGTSWVAATEISTRSVDNGFTEHTYLNTVTGSTQYRIRIHMTSPAAHITPVGRDLRAIIY